MKLNINDIYTSLIASLGDKKRHLMIPNFDAIITKFNR